ncbi:MAG: hypothetical protein R3Y28_08195 [Candidatus Gastranaerophilales bacterium]
MISAVSNTQQTNPNFGMALKVNPGKVLNSLNLDDKGTLVLKKMEHAHNDKFDVLVGDEIQLLRNSDEAVIASVNPLKKQNFFEKIFRPKKSVLETLDNYLAEAEVMRKDAIQDDLTALEDEAINSALKSLYAKNGIPE